ncbi:PREDICTED: multiple organellar RNA editing factor 3, mitochondrial [Nelumbo nucifera]|uniref:MORF/ORRM1/DAG-like MORF domain-containing protein n=2 Tax=Nelumbo nucifera TaxID=4432 RepID=A0A822Y157_NELNU|nr:PREDICTED: multiple organellar RNA editing factor 3, mitochondrial [Nelumbo nucifera]DAD25251.1 TPA_asm: hypothetical protein HUJ06_026715 [Nelumbo nucifera]
MALSSLRLRRSLSLSSSLFRHHRFFSATSSASSSFSVLDRPISSASLITNILQNPSPRFPSNPFRIQSLSFHSSPSLSYSSSSRSRNDDEKISPDTILFEGCDYNHWLITMEFPKDPKPTPEEMVETYVQTLAKVVGSVEEAKKRMYACSTTTYTGFQAVMTEEMSEKFRGLPGVVFILPDSYIDPVNKEYGGDKYINGTIIPRPPPVQYGRSQGRYGDRNRNYDRPRYDRQRDSMPTQQGNPPYDRQGSMQGDGRNYGPQQNYAPQQNYPPQQNYQPQQNYPSQQNYAPQQNYGSTGQGERRDFRPTGNMDYAPGGQDNYQRERRDAMPSYQRDNNQGAQGNYYSQERRDLPQGDRRDYAPPEHRDLNRNFGPQSGGNYGQGAGSGYGQSYPGHGEPQNFSQVERRDDMQGDQRNHAPQGQFGVNQF